MNPLVPDGGERFLELFVQGVKTALERSCIGPVDARVLRVQARQGVGHRPDHHFSVRGVHPEVQVEFAHAVLVAVFLVHVGVVVMVVVACLRVRVLVVVALVVVVLLAGVLFVFVPFVVVDGGDRRAPRLRRDPHGRRASRSACARRGRGLRGRRGRRGVRRRARRPHDRRGRHGRARPMPRLRACEEGRCPRPAKARGRRRSSARASIGWTRNDSSPSPIQTTRSACSRACASEGRKRPRMRRRSARDEQGRLPDPVHDPRKERVNRLDARDRGRPLGRGCYSRAPGESCSSGESRQDVANACHGEILRFRISGVAAK